MTRVSRLPVLPEAEEAKILVAYLRIHNYKFHHSPNETGSSLEARRRAIRMKQQGTSSGFPDYMIIVNGHLIFIELKSKKGYLTAEQKVWLAELNKVDNVQAFVAKGADEAIAIVKQYAASPNVNIAGSLEPPSSLF